MVLKLELKVWYDDTTVRKEERIRHGLEDAINTAVDEGLLTRADSRLLVDTYHYSVEIVRE